MEVIATYYLESINSNLLLIKDHSIIDSYYHFQSALFTYLNDSVLSTGILLDDDDNLSIKHALDNNLVSVTNITESEIDIAFNLNTDERWILDECNDSVGRLYEFARNNTDLFIPSGPPILK